MTDARSAGADPGARSGRTKDWIDPMTDAGSARADPGARSGHAEPIPGDQPRPGGPRPATGPNRTRPAGGPTRHPVVAFFRANPQVFVLLVICVVLGLGTFFAVLFGLVTAGSDQTTGEPSGAILAAHTTLTAALGAHATLTPGHAAHAAHATVTATRGTVTALGRLSL